MRAARPTSLRSGPRPLSGDPGDVPPAATVWRRRSGTSEGAAADIDRLRDVGEARNATLYFKEVPILYNAVDGLSRIHQLGARAGFLLPAHVRQLRRPAARSSRMPFYWDIKPSMDHTLAPRVTVAGGACLPGNEFRYREAHMRQQLRGAISTTASRVNRSRWAVPCSLTARIWVAGFAAGTQSVREVSDDAYYTDLVGARSRLPPQSSAATGGAG